MNAQQFYQQQKDEHSQLYEKAAGQYFLIGTLRLVVFAATCLLSYLFWGSILLLPVILAGIVVFLFLVHRGTDVRYLRDKEAQLIQINEEELAVLQGNWSSFDGGTRFRNAGHSFSLDMDMFGERSVYQLINRTVTGKGAEKLANTFLNGSADQKQVAEAIEALSVHSQWCQQFMAEGRIFDRQERDRELAGVLSVPSGTDQLGKVLRILIPAVSSIVTIAYGLNLISSTVLGIWIVLALGMIGSRLKKTNALTGKVTSRSALVKMMKRQVRSFEQLGSDDSVIARKKSEWTAENGFYEALSSLEKLQDRMDYRNNLLVGLVLNYFLAWDLKLAFDWDRWKDRFSQCIEDGEEGIAELEMWISGAVYRFNFPESTYAEFSMDHSLEIKGLWHPFVKRDKRVCNDVTMKAEEHFLVITGPNMAGKSTFLRSLGLIMICADAGFPVLCSSCRIPRAKLFSSMRTSDDLNQESSYFHAELTRLRFIMDAIEKGVPVFVILDEILKGTNSKDKEEGSAKFLLKLAGIGARGIIATHDLSLCQLATDDVRFRNMYFDSQISGDELSFDYTLRDGICKNMNASFLLRKMNLVD